jgi:WhiB family transcriptional regulator, redox-sensing transcriptional regulator
MDACQQFDITGDDLDWSEAACRHRGFTELFFSELIPEINRAKDLCRTCPLLEPCLRGAIVRREPAGVWGGQLFVNGRILAQKRKRGRPPKVRPVEPDLVLPPAIAQLLAQIA